MSSTSVKLEIFSPRWGHTDTYTVDLHNDYMTISMHPRTTKVTWVDNCDPEWSIETVQDILNNDSIYAPEITQDLFERAWKAWRDGEIDNKQVDDELQLLAGWINAVTAAKPKSDFWGKYF
jgi:hypothetical protein